MEISDILGYFELENNDRLEELTENLQEILTLPHSFLTLNWHESHDFLWISPQIEEISGYPFQSFQKLGIPFILSITPKSLIPEVSETLGSWRQVLESDPGQILNSVIMDVPGALEHTNGDTIDLVCQSLVLDYAPGKITTYLILTVSFVKDGVKKDLENTVQRANGLQRKIHELYMLMKPNRFKMLNSYLSLTKREKEIAQLIRDGNSSGEIAAILHISQGTVTSHRKNLLRKLDVKNTAELLKLLSRVID